jgi:ribosomal protein S12 methylthiotransferase
LVLRTTYILGFPGETEDDFKRLWQFQNDYQIERVGVFPYSPEEDTAASRLDRQVPEDVVSDRIDRLMTLVMDQSYERNRKHVGKKIQVLIDEKIEDDYYIARAYDQAPEIDGYTRARGKFELGRFYDLRITSCEAYDLEGEEWKEG